MEGAIGTILTSIALWSAAGVTLFAVFWVIRRRLRWLFRFLGRLLGIFDVVLVRTFPRFLLLENDAIVARYGRIAIYFAVVLVAGALTPPHVGLGVLGFGFLSALAIIRYWARDEFERAKETRVEEIWYESEEPDYRDEALISTAFLFALFPIAFLQLSEFGYFAAPDAARPWEWALFVIGELGKAIPFVDWSEVYGWENPSAIEVARIEGKHAVFFMRVTFDLVFLNGVITLVEIFSRIERGQDSRTLPPIKEALEHCDYPTFRSLAADLSRPAEMATLVRNGLKEILLQHIRERLINNADADRSVVKLLMQLSEEYAEYEGADLQNIAPDEGPIRDVIIEAVALFLFDEYRYARSDALEALVALDADEYMPILTDAIREGKTGDETLTEIGNRFGRSLISEALDEEGAILGYVKTLADENLPSYQFVREPILLGLLSEMVYEARRGGDVNDIAQTVLSLVAIGSEGSSLEEIFYATSKSEDYRVRRELVRLLAEVGAANSGDLLTELIDDPTTNVRIAAVSAVGQLLGPRALDSLIRRLDSEIERNGAVRGAAAKALGQIPDPAAISALITALRVDSRAQVRSAAAQALGAIGGHEALAALQAAVDSDRSLGVQTAARRAIRRIERAVQEAEDES